MQASSGSAIYPNVSYDILLRREILDESLLFGYVEDVAALTTRVVKQSTLVHW